MLRTMLLSAVALTATASTALSAQHRDIDAAVERLTPPLTRLRQHFHQNPELSNREFETAKTIVEHLRSVGITEIQTGVAHTGVVAVLRGGRAGPVVAVRADMDALPVTEDTPYPFKSTKRATYLGQEVGVMHACGHDIHVAVQLGVASVLAGMRDRLPGTVKFIFQPAEEGPPPGESGGAALMIEQGVLEDPPPSAIFGLHTYAHLEVGKIGYTPGPALASADGFTAVIRGRQAHGAAPHMSVDAVVMASQAVLALQTIRSRNISPLEPGVVTVGIMRGGTRANIIPAEVELMGTVRAYNPEVQDLVERRMREILDGITRAAGGSFELRYSRGVPPTVNDTALTERMVPSLGRAVGAANVGRIEPWMASEDFAFFANRIPALFFRLGTLKPGTTSGDHHAPNFMADDGAIPVGVKAMAYVVWDYLAAGGGS